MGIPLAALAIRPPEQPPDQLGNVGRAIQLKQLMAAAPLQQQQLQQQVQASAQENQMRQSQIQDQDATTKAMQSWDGKNLDDLPNLVLKHGGSSTAVMGLKTNILDQKSKLTKLDDDTFKLQQTKNDALLGQLQAVTQGDDAGLPARLTQAAQNAQQQGLLDPQHAQQILLMAQQVQDPKKLKDALTVYEKTLMGQKEQFKQANDERETAAKELTAKTGAQRLQLESQGVLGPAAGVDRQEMADWLGKNPGKGPADFMAYKAKLVPQFNFNLQGGGAANAPKADDPLVQAVANNKMKISEAITPRTPLPIRKQFLAAVLQANPEFNSATYDVEKGVDKAFTSGAYSQQLNSINRAREHMGTFLELAKNIDNTDVQAVNKIKNAFKTQFGSDAPVNLAIAKQAFASEVGKSFAGANVALADRQELDHQIGTSSSWAQLSGAAKTADTLLAGAQKALKQTYEAGKSGRPNFGEGNAPSGGVEIPSGAKTATGPSGHKIFVQDGKWIDSVTGKPLQ